MILRAEVGLMLPYLEPVKTTLMEVEAAPQLSKIVAEFR